MTTQRTHSMTTALYRFFDAEGALLYVGISHRLNGRLSAHKKEKPWDEVAQITLEHFPTREEAAEAEVRAIKQEAPAWNVAHSLGVSIRNHRESYKQTAERLWPYVYWINGSGEWATVAHCRVTTILLHRDLASAENALAAINSSACGGSCHRDHWLYNLQTGFSAGNGVDATAELFPDELDKYRDLVWLEWGWGNTDIVGAGPFASVSECSGNSVYLFLREHDARRYAETIDESDCGRLCYGSKEHRLYDLRHETWSDLRQ